MKTTQELDAVANEMRAILKKHDLAGSFVIAGPNTGVSGGHLDTTWSHTTTINQSHIEVSCKGFDQLGDTVTLLLAIRDMLINRMESVEGAAKQLIAQFPEGTTFNQTTRRIG